MTGLVTWVYGLVVYIVVYIALATPLVPVLSEKVKSYIIKHLVIAKNIQPI